MVGNLTARLRLPRTLRLLGGLGLLALAAGSAAIMLTLPDSAPDPTGRLGVLIGHFLFGFYAFAFAATAIPTLVHPERSLPAVLGTLACIAATLMTLQMFPLALPPAAVGFLLYLSLPRKPRRSQR